jgi:hypothetical protein
VFALGITANSANDAGGVTFQHIAIASTTTKARFACRNNTGTLYPSVGTVYYHGNGVLDYAALGLIANF